MAERKRNGRSRKAAASPARDDAPRQLTPEELVGRIVVGVERRDGGGETLLVLRVADGECAIRVAGEA